MLYFMFIRRCAPVHFSAISETFRLFIDIFSRFHLSPDLQMIMVDHTRYGFPDLFFRLAVVGVRSILAAIMFIEQCGADG